MSREPPSPTAPFGCTLHWGRALRNRIGALFTITRRTQNFGEFGSVHGALRGDKTAPMFGFAIYIMPVCLALYLKILRFNPGSPFS